MSKVFEIFAALTMDTADFDRAVLRATGAGKSLAASLQGLSRTGQNSMGALRTSVTGTWREIAAAIQQAIEKAQLFFGLNGGQTPQLPGHDTGLRYVPYDNYVARLHRGETVLTRLEAESWRAGQRSVPAAVDPAAIGEAVRRAVSGLTVEMDGQTVGRMVAPAVSAAMGSQTRARRYTG